MKTVAEHPVSSTLATSGVASRDVLLRAYRLMALSRRLDDKEIQLKNQSQIFFQISGAGHEAILVAAGLALRPGIDWAYPYYRDRAFCLALGVTPLDMLLQGVGAKDDPSSGGRQMPSHWGHTRWNIVSGSSPTGTQCLQAIGCAEATRLLTELPRLPDAERPAPDAVTYVSVGEGTTSEGEFWESLNTASNGRLPLVYLIEDNGYAISVPVEVQTPGGDISRLVETFPHLKIFRVDGTDLVASLDVMQEAVAYARSGEGPAFVHAKVVRPYSHSLSDDERLYKTADERAREAARDPIKRAADYLLAEGLATREELDTLHAEVEREVNVATDIALAAEKPARDTAALYVYSPDVDVTADTWRAEPLVEGKPDTMVSAINRTLRDEMAANPRIVVFGEDVADVSRECALAECSGKGGVFKVTHGLQREFGGQRVFNSPLAEANIVGRRHRHGDPRAQARRRDPVLRLHLAGVHADS